MKPKYKQILEILRSLHPYGRKFVTPTSPGGHLFTYVFRLRGLDEYTAKTYSIFIFTRGRFEPSAHNETNEILRKNGFTEFRR